MPNEEQRAASKISLYRGRHQGRRHDGGSRRQGSFRGGHARTRILFAHEEIKEIVAFQEQHRGGNRQAQAANSRSALTGEDVKAAVREYAYDKVQVDPSTPSTAPSATPREEQVKAEVAEHFAEQLRRPRCRGWPTRCTT